MPADARLALAEDLGQILDVELAAGQQRQDAQARRLPGGAQSGQAHGRGTGPGWHLGLATFDIKICLYVFYTIYKSGRDQCARRKHSTKTMRTL